MHTRSVLRRGAHTVRSDHVAVDLLNWARIGPHALKLSSRFGLGTFGALHGAVAVEQVAAGEELVRVPRARTIHLREGARPPAGVSEAYWREAHWVERLALLLLRERARGRDFEPFVASLPQQFDTPIHWSDSELSELQVARDRRSAAAAAASSRGRGLHLSTRGSPRPARRTNPSRRACALGGGRSTSATWRRSRLPRRWGSRATPSARTSSCGRPSASPPAPSSPIQSSTGVRACDATGGST